MSIQINEPARSDKNNSSASEFLGYALRSDVNTLREDMGAALKLMAQEQGKSINLVRASTQAELSTAYTEFRRTLEFTSKDTTDKWRVVQVSIGDGLNAILREHMKLAAEVAVIKAHLEHRPKRTRRERFFRWIVGLSE